MHCKFLPQDLNARLNGTICRYDGHPYYVQVGERHTLVLCRLDNGGGIYKEIQYNDPLFDISTPPLGYVNFPRQTLYLSRVPTRRYKQGIDQQNTSWAELPLTKDERQRRQMRGQRTGVGGGQLISLHVQNMMLGIYEPVQEVVAQLRAGMYDTRAISRTVAFRIDAIGLMSVYFKNTLIGHVFPNSNIITVPSNEMGWIVSAHIQGFGMEVE